MAQFFNNTVNGLICYFTATAGCANLSVYAWLFLFIYIVYVLSSLQFLIWSQSAVYTIATSTTALPLLGIWWSLFQVTSIEKGILFPSKKKKKQLTRACSRSTEVGSICDR